MNSAGQSSPLVNGQVIGINQQLAVYVAGVAIATAAAPLDLASFSIPFARYLVQNIIVESQVAAGTLAAATIDLRTAPAGGGVSCLAAPVALVNLTAANLAQVIAALQNVVQTAPSLTIRQTVNSINAGQVAFALEIQPLP